MQADVVPERRFLTSVGVQQKTHSLSVLKIREYVNERAVQRILYKSALSGCVRHQYIDVRKYIQTVLTYVLTNALCIFGDSSGGNRDSPPLPIYSRVPVAQRKEGLGILYV